MSRRHRGLAQVQPERIHFQESPDGLWWIEGTDLAHFQRLTGLRCEGQRVGFMPSAVYGYVDELAKQGVALAVLRDCSFYTIGVAKREKPQPVQSSVLFLAPELLLDRVQLQRMERDTVLNKARLREQAATDWGTIYVYRVYDEVYEIDWELTKVPRDSLETKLFAAHKLGKKVACRVVAPKTQRNGKRSDESGEYDATSTTNGKGQLRLLF